MPEGADSEQVQALLDEVFLDGATIVPKKRGYKNTAEVLKDYFHHAADEVYNKLHHNAKLHFIRYMDIQTDVYPEMINEAVGYVVDRTKPEFHEIFGKLNDWKKNWFRRYIKVADGLQQNYMTKGAWEKITDPDVLKGLYSDKCAYEPIHQMLTACDDRLVDWRVTFGNASVNSMYRTLFTYTMLYVPSNSPGPWKSNQ